MNGRAGRYGLAFWSLLVVLFLWVPLAIILVYAFNTSNIQSWPIPGFTLKWFRIAWQDQEARTALLLSLKAGLAATAVALVLGTMAAVAVSRFRFFGREAFSFLLVLPIALPGVITGIALSSFYTFWGVPFSLWTIVIGHATFCVVIAYNNVVARLRRLPRSPEEASADLGADSWLTFRRITVPGMRTALLSGALLSFALSFDEIIVTLFTAGAGTQTIPIWIFASIQRPTELPVVNVVALVLLLLSVIPVYLAQRIGGEAAGITR